MLWPGGALLNHIDILMDRTLKQEKALIQFFDELNDFLPAHLKDRPFACNVHKSRSVKDLIESIGIPHTEVDVIMVDNQSVAFGHLIRGGESIKVYAANQQFTEAPLIHNFPRTSPEQGFVLDVHLGKLANYLRMLGFDTLYRNDYSDATLATISAQQNRILLTRDRMLLMRKNVRYGYIVRSDKPREQISEVMTRFDGFAAASETMRCMQCNGIIQAVEKKQIEAKLQPLTKKYYHEFYQCADCQKIYWEGSHYSKIQSLAQSIRAEKT